jgi:hypothetical protein
LNLKALFEAEEAKQAQKPILAVAASDAFEANRLMLED